MNGNDIGGVCVGNGLLGAGLGDEVVNTPEHQALAKEAADQGLVLLKNEGNTLPLDASKVKSVAMLGRNALATNNMQGNYFGTAPFLISPADGVGAYVSNNTVSACADSGSACSANEMQKATAAASTLGLLQPRLSRLLDMTSCPLLRFR